MGTLTRSIRHLGLLVVLSCPVLTCPAQETPSRGGALTVTLENDSFTGSDNNYTNGLGISWASSAIETYDERSFVRRWGQFWSFLPFVGNDGYRTYASWSRRRCTRRTTSRTRTRPRTINRMQERCTSTTTSMPRGNVGPMQAPDLTERRRFADDS
jgi:hypothetical protein